MARTTQKCLHSEPEIAEKLLEQNANKVLLLWNVDKDENKVGVSIAKNLRGKTGVVKMRFDGNHMQYTELDEPYATPKNGEDGTATMINEIGQLMGKAEREKGKRGERLLRDLLKLNGFEDARR